MAKKLRIKSNVVHTLCVIKGKHISCVHRFHDGESKNQCELLGKSCNNGLWSEKTCGITLQVNKYQRELGIK